MTSSAAGDFLQASHEEQTRRLGELAARALDAWSMDGAALELVKYRENTVFAVTSSAGERFAMRIHRPGYREDAEILSELEWMKSLDQAGIRTPEPIPTRTGDLLCTVGADGVPGPRQCDLFGWISGVSTGTLEGGIAGDGEGARQTYAEVGELAARVHAHGVAWERPAGFTRPRWDSEALVGEHPTFGRFEDLDVLSDEQRGLLLAARDRVRAKLDGFGRAPEHWGLLHGDLLPDNILVNAVGPNLIDFDDCGEGWYGFELATGLFPMLTQEIFQELLDAYVEGYRRVRAFPEESLEMLPTFMMARALSYLGWPVGRPEMHEMQVLKSFLAEMVSSLAALYLQEA